MIKFCISSRATPELLAKADEIYIAWRDRAQILDLVTDYPNATLTVEIPLGVEDFTIKEALNYKTLTKDKILYMLNDMKLVQDFLINSIPYFLTYRARSFYELRALKDLGVEYAYIDAPAFFNMVEVQKLELPIRVTPHLANNTLLPHRDGVCGTWIRPEDLEYYDPCVVELYMETNDRQEILYNIYAVEHSWDGELGLIINDLKYHGNNRLIGNEFSTRRLTCGQMCQQTGRCRLCYTLLDLANPIMLKEYKEKVNV